MTENPFRKLPLVLLLNQYQLLNQPQYQQGDLQQAHNHQPIQEPNNQPPNETALQLLHTGTYFGESIGLSCRANSPATVGLLLLDLTFPHPQLLPHLLLPGAKTNCDLRFHCHRIKSTLLDRQGYHRSNRNQTTRSQPTQTQSKQNISKSTHPYILPYKTKDCPNLSSNSSK